VGRSFLSGTWALISFVIVGGMLLTSCERSSKSADEEEWVTLFNGRDLDDWTPRIRRHLAGVNYLNTFRVDNGLLTVSYDGYDEFDEQFGHIFYKDLHSQDPETMPPDQDFPISLEVQFLGGLSDGNPRPTGNMCSPGTHIEYQGEFTDTHCINSTSPTFDGDQWAVAEALVFGADKIVHYINGEAVIEYGNTTFGGGVVSGHRPEMKPEGEPLGEGYISLQSEGHPIQFRRVELLNLKGCMDLKAKNFKSYFVAGDPESCRY